MGKQLTQKQVDVLRHFAACQEPLYVAQGLQDQLRATFTKAMQELRSAGLLDDHVVTPMGYVELAARGYGDPCAHCGCTKFEASEWRTFIRCAKCRTIWRRDGNGEGWVDGTEA